MAEWDWLTEALAGIPPEDLTLAGDALWPRDWVQELQGIPSTEWPRDWVGELQNIPPEDLTLAGDALVEQNAGGYPDVVSRALNALAKGATTSLTSGWLNGPGAGGGINIPILDFGDAPRAAAVPSVTPPNAALRDLPSPPAPAPFTPLAASSPTSAREGLPGSGLDDLLALLTSRGGTEHFPETRARLPQQGLAALLSGRL